AKGPIYSKCELCKIMPVVEWLRVTECIMEHCLRDTVCIAEHCLHDTEAFPGYYTLFPLEASKLADLLSSLTSNPLILSALASAIRRFKFVGHRSSSPNLPMSSTWYLSSAGALLWIADLLSSLTSDPFKLSALAFVVRRYKFVAPKLGSQNLPMSST
ncbi:hypothetical protein HAX54_035368, partial [Datura stramonium]|nr:hypothetical protein [Datura stramonium]